MSCLKKKWKKKIEIIKIENKATNTSCFYIKRCYLRVPTDEKEIFNLRNFITQNKMEIIFCQIFKI